MIASTVGLDQSQTKGRAVRQRDFGKSMAVTMKALPEPDSHHLSAAQGWLGLGNCFEANAELENISPQLRTHPDVLDVHWQIYAAAKKWDAALDIATALTALVPGDP